MTMTTTTRVIGLFVLLLVCYGAAGLGSIATGPEIGGWYRQLNKPAWQPPDWVFGPVWTLLYGMMAVAAWIVWQQGGVRVAAVPLGLFAIQLLLNIAWSWIFFGLHRPGWAFAEILLLWLAIAATMAAFFARSAVAGWLMAPYLVWVTFAGALNWAIWRLNSG